jgi:hypothetical protein
VTAAVDADEKLFFQIRLSRDGEDQAVNTLGLISRGNLGENYLHQLWKALFVDRRVKDSLRRMFESRDKGLVRLIRKRVPNLQPKEIAQSLRRLEFRIELPALAFEPTKGVRSSSKQSKSVKGREGAGRKAAQTRQILAQVSLASLIRSGALILPLQLFRHYKGHDLKATLLPDGKVEFRGAVYDTCSTAAEHARAVVTGRKMNTNGWVFWQFVDQAGRKRQLDHVRQQFLATLRNKPE